jgi:hypothetical protein
MACDIRRIIARLVDDPRSRQLSAATVSQNLRALSPDW